jgi:hypothetical protein
MIEEREIAQHLVNLGLPEDAQAWLLDLWNLTQVLDDAMDGDKPGKADVSRAVWAVFQNMPCNSFYQSRMSLLQPVLVLQLLKWEAANEAEAAGFRDARTYVWRAGFYDVVMMACHLCGINARREVMEMYGEPFAAYLEEGS